LGLSDIMVEGYEKEAQAEETKESEVVAVEKS
jgi:hypothetical protein